jgi:predicted DNA-binding protein with PD1-like motif
MHKVREICAHCTPQSAPGSGPNSRENHMKAIVKAASARPKLFAALALICAAVSFVAPQASAQAAAQTGAQTPKQYTPPTGEPVPQSSTLADAPPAPALPADWTKQLADHHESIVTDRVRIHVFRLRPGDDLLGGIRAYVKANHIQAAVLLSAVGSLTQASIRFANQPEAHIHTGHFEIVSITGTVEEGSEHVHLSISTGQGTMIGGHLMTGCKIYTTGEITLAELIGVHFARETDTQGSGWDELKIYPSKP